MLDAGAEPIPSRRRPAALLDRPEALAAAALVVIAVVVSLHHVPRNTPGFHRDEASLALNAFTISQGLRDQDGAFLPLYFVSYDDYKSPVFVYLLAGVFRVADVTASAARQTGSAVVLAGVLLLGVLAYRRTRSATVAALIVLLGALTPWLYELGRTAFEATTEPLALAAVLLAADWGWRASAPALARGVPLGLALGGLTYVYAAGRVLAPLLALALLVFAARGRLAWLLAAWGTYAAALVPLALHWRNHPGALTARFEATTFVEEGMSRWEAVRRALGNYAADANVWHWIASGDPKPYIHSWGAGQLFGAVVVLAALGAAAVLARRPADRFWAFVLVALVVAPVPGALTADRHHALRTLALPVVLLVLAAPGLAALLAAARRRGAVGRLALAGCAVLAGAVVVQTIVFQKYFDRNGPGRAEFFEAGVPGLLERAFAGGRTVHVDYDDRYAQTHALWYAASHDLPSERVVVLADGGIPAPGAMVFGRLQECDYVCRELDRFADYWIAQAVGPKP